MAVIFPVCPVCGVKPVVEEKSPRLFGVLGHAEKIMCSNKHCGAVFEQKGPSTFRLVPSARFENIYEGMSLTHKEWKRIAKGGFSDEEREMKKIKNGELPKLDPSELDIMIKKNEAAHAKGAVEYYEERMVRHHSGSYAGPSIRVAKGVSWRMGGYKGKSTSAPEIRHIDTGVMVLTSRRIIFTGEYKSWSIPLKKIMSVKQAGDNMLQITKEGRSKAFYITCNAPVVKILIKAAVRNL